MKKILVTLMIFMLAMGLCCTTAQAAVNQKTIELKINSTVYKDAGTNKTLLAAPFMDNKTDRTMVPLRMIAESMDAVVDYQPVGRKVTVDKENKHLALQLGSTIWANGQNYGTAVEKSGTTFVPVRYITEQLGANVEWDGANNRVFVYINLGNNTETKVEKPVENNQEKPGNEQEPADTKDPVIKPEVKPYKIDTLAKASVFGSTYGKFLCQHGDTVYYLGDDSDDGVREINLKTGKSKTLFDWRNEEVEYEGKNYDIIKIHHLYYDSGRNIPVIYVDLLSEDSVSGKLTNKVAMVNAKNGNVIYAYKVNGLGGYLHSTYVNYDIEGEPTKPIILGTDEDSNLIVSTNHQVFRCFAPEYDMQYGKEKLGYLGDSAFNYFLDGKNMHMIGMLGFYQYRNAQLTKQFAVSTNPSTVANQKFYTINQAGVMCADFNGNIIDRILIDDIEIADNRSLFGNISSKLFVNSDGNVILYDFDNKCFRMISENEEYTE